MNTINVNIILLYYSTLYPVNCSIFQLHLKNIYSSTSLDFYSNSSGKWGWSVIAAKEGGRGCKSCQVILGHVGKTVQFLNFYLSLLS